MHSPFGARRRALAGLAAAGLLLTSASVRAAPPSVPSLRLIGASDAVTLERHRERVWLDLGVWAAASGGDLEIQVGRDDYDSPITARQVDSSTKQTLRAIPSDDVDGWRGLRDFTRVVFRDETGTVVAARRLDFCPNSWDRQRVDDSGPDVPRYPTEGCTSHFPFTKGTVWGIDDGWAADALTSGERGGAYLRVAPGTYAVTVRLTRHYARLFEVSAGDAKVHLEVVVEGSRSRVGPDSLSASRTGGSEGPMGTASVPTVSAPDPATLPDLVALPAWNIRTRGGRARDLLTFNATPWNAGPSRLHVEGFRRDGEDVMDAYQYFYDASGTATGRAPVGTLEFDRRDGHHHWHFRQFARYRLLTADDLAEVVRSRKQSFCIAPTDAVDLLVPGAMLNPYELGLHSACGESSSIWVREVLQAGWGDTYSQSVAGQAFDITNVPNGRYYVEASVNPRGRLFDADPANDEELRLIRLRGTRGDRRVEVSAWHGITR